MNTQIKRILLKITFAAAILAVGFGFVNFADAGLLPAMPEINSVEVTEQTAETSGQPDEKPVVRCPNKSFILRTGCKTVKPVKEDAETVEQKSATEKASANGNQNSPAKLP